MCCESYAICKSGGTRGVPENSLAKVWAGPRFSICAKIAISSDLVAHFGVKFCVSVALRALSSTISNCTSDSYSLSRRVILYHARDLGNQRAKCDDIGPKLFILFGCLFWHNSSFINSFWLRLFVLRVLYHMQVRETTRCSRKFNGKSLGQGKVEHMGENRDFE